MFETNYYTQWLIQKQHRAEQLRSAERARLAHSTPLSQRWYSVPAILGRISAGLGVLCPEFAPVSRTQRSCCQVACC
jgi:hypothetical protein